TILVNKAIKKNKDSQKPTIVSKENKMKYSDQLTSLKNRNYLNDNLEMWDNSEVYPQAIIVIDLNNISYINDNYGHVEGDKVITEAANILILNQVENSDIIRTSGNEFLIYMVGHDEKTVISNIKKLKKELKDLTHNFGAAIGYSMIVDAIKTIDDAINEATLDMRDDKDAQENDDK
ncbi:MAG: GGDEF domain-containing protein, partial [Bacilli bacterium]|nr:GGDEF domain-containing protein [Bacilli bacterium]